MNLFFQKLDKFELFPMLSSELRVLIWKASIVPRRVKASLKWIDEVDESTGYRTCILVSAMKNPSVLHACQESRTTVGAEYKILLGGTEHSKLFNQSMDTLVLDKCKFWLCGKFINAMSPWMKHKFARIRKLEIGDMWLEPMVYDAMCELLYGTDALFDEKQVEREVVSGYFQSLELLTLKAGKYSGLLLDEGNMELVRTLVVHFMEHKSEKMPGFKIPKVVIDGSQGLRGRPPRWMSGQ